MLHAFLSINVQDTQDIQYIQDIEKRMAFTYFFTPILCSLCRHFELILDYDRFWKDFFCNFLEFLGLNESSKIYLKKYFLYNVRYHF